MNGLMQSVLIMRDFLYEAEKRNINNIRKNLLDDEKN